MPNKISQSTSWLPGQLLLPLIPPELNLTNCLGRSVLPRSWHTQRLQEAINFRGQTTHPLALQCVAGFAPVILYR